jgi:acyl-CoA reductase-like NAD-dependent aldehyde dehydrogenase
MSSRLQVFSPSDRSLLAELDWDGPERVDKALVTAQQIHQRRDLWMPKYRRIELLEALVGAIAGRHEEITRTAASEGGKPWKDSVVEIDRAILGVKAAIHHLFTRAGEEVPMGQSAATADRMAWRIFEPIGPVVAISAFNHPFNLLIHQAIPAIAAGTPVILKPASATPLSGLLLKELLDQIGLPEGWVQVLNCSNELTQQLATDPRVQFVSFIGSARVGFMLKSKLAPHTDCVLEHGGAAPVIIEPDVDLAAITPGLIRAGFYHAGQVCVSVQRIFVHDSIANAFVEAYTEAAGNQVTGHALDANTDVGPLIRPSEVERVHQWVSQAVEQGAKLTIGGEPLSETHYPPTVLVDPPVDSLVSREEIFGPVVCIYRYSDQEEALRRANELPFAFQAAVYCRDLDRAFDVACRLKGSAVMINDHTAFRADWMPFGGFELSGLRLGGIPYTIDDYSRKKMLVIKSPAFNSF